MTNLLKTLTSANAPPLTSRARAFTLIEVLVVVAIAALLIAILVPALSSGRRSAKALVGVSNLRALAQTKLAYTNDHQEYFLNPFRAQWPTDPATFGANPPKWHTAFGSADQSLRWDFQFECPEYRADVYTDAFSELWASFFADYRGTVRVSEDQFSPADGHLLDAYQDIRDTPLGKGGSKLFPSSFMYSPTFWTKPERYPIGGSRAPMAPEWLRNNQVSSVTYPSAKVMLWERCNFAQSSTRGGDIGLSSARNVATADGSVIFLQMRDIVDAMSGTGGGSGRGVSAPSNGPLIYCNTPSGPEFFFGTAGGIRGRDIPR
jgi:prepilin-type N-terminal cleavage/methylation domain-containing protein